MEEHVKSKEDIDTNACEKEKNTEENVEVWMTCKSFDVSTGWKNGGKLCYVITHNIIWTNQKTKSFVYCWQGAHAF